MYDTYVNANIGNATSSHKKNNDTVCCSEKLKTQVINGRLLEKNLEILFSKGDDLGRGMKFCRSPVRPTFHRIGLADRQRLS